MKMSVLVRSDPITDHREHLSAHTHVTKELIDDSLIDVTALTFDNISDAIDEYCEKNHVLPVDHAIYRLTIEVDVEVVE